jgi:SAM-dependent methyltransferase
MTAEMAHVSHYYRWIFDTIRPRLGARVLEVGPGYGNLAALILGDGRDYLGVDLDGPTIERLRETLDGARLLHGDICQAAVQAEVRAFAPDSVVSFNVIEHLADPAPLLRALAAVAPGAALILFVPALPVLYGTLDEQAGHFRRYTMAALRAALDGIADIEELDYFNGLGAFAWFVAARVLRLPLNGEATSQSISLYDRLCVPVARRLDPLTRRFFGQSILCHSRLRSPTTVQL